MVESWNKTMSQNYQFGDDWSAISCFVNMNRSNVKLDAVTFILSLATVVSLGDLRLGAQIHGMTIKSGFDVNINVSNGIINMYSKMGCKDYSLSRRK